MIYNYMDYWNIPMDEFYRYSRWVIDHWDVLPHRKWIRQPTVP